MVMNHVCVESCARKLDNEKWREVEAMNTLCNKVVTIISCNSNNCPFGFNIHSEFLRGYFANVFHHQKY
eukprot:scaffold216_cov93-Skeletonema_marinoi.AAC.6